MRIALLAHTTFVDPSALSPVWAGLLDREQDTDADLLAEGAARSCYESWSKPNPATATNKGYLNHILEVKHHSVLSHASITLYITGVSRALTHELIRSRFLAFSQVSQRYVDESDASFVMPPGGSADEHGALYELREMALAVYKDIFEDRVKHGATRKEARQAARSALPNATETRIVVTGNVRAWRDFIIQRNTPGADHEIQELAVGVLDILRELAPNSVSDLTKELYG